MSTQPRYAGKVLLCLAFLMVGLMFGSGSLSAAKVEINHFWWGGNPDRVMELAKESFEAQHPGVTVNLIGDTTIEKLMVSSATGVVDTMVIDAPWFAELYSNKVFRPLNSLIDRDTNTKQALERDFWPGSYKWAERDGQLFAMPYIWMQAQVLFYNKGMFANAGLADPNDGWTWNDLVTPAKKLTISEKNQWGLRFDASWKGLAKFALMNGSGFVDDQLVPRKATLNDERTLETGEFWVNLVAKDKVMGGSFASGNVGMNIEWWGTKAGWSTPSKPLPFDYDMVAPPKGPKGGDDAVYPVALNALAISASSRNPELALAWIVHLLSSEVMKQGTANGGGIPTRRSIVTSPTWLKAGGLHNEAVLIPLQKPVPQYPLTAAWRDIEGVVKPQTDLAFAGGADIRMVLQAVNDRVTALIRQYM